MGRNFTRLHQNIPARPLFDSKVFSFHKSSHRFTFPLASDRCARCWQSINSRWVNLWVETSPNFVWCPSVVGWLKYDDTQMFDDVCTVRFVQTELKIPFGCFFRGRYLFWEFFSFFFGIFFLFLVPWSPGPLIPWCPGHLVPLHLVPSLSGPQCPGPLVPWSSGPLVPWSSGPLLLWSSGFLVLCSFSFLFF